MIIIKVWNLVRISKMGYRGHKVREVLLEKWSLQTLLNKG